MTGDRPRKSKDAANENMAASQRVRRGRPKQDLRKAFDQAADGDDSVSIGDGAPI